MNYALTSPPMTEFLTCNEPVGLFAEQLPWELQDSGTNTKMTSVRVSRGCEGQNQTQQMKQNKNMWIHEQVRVWLWLPNVYFSFFYDKNATLLGQVAKKHTSSPFKQQTFSKITLILKITLKLLTDSWGWITCKIWDTQLSQRSSV